MMRPVMPEEEHVEIQYERQQIIDPEIEEYLELQDGRANDPETDYGNGGTDLETGPSDQVCPVQEGELLKEERQVKEEEYIPYAEYPADKAREEGRRREGQEDEVVALKAVRAKRSPERKPVMEEEVIIEEVELVKGREAVVAGRGKAKQGRGVYKKEYGDKPGEQAVASMFSSHRIMGRSWLMAKRQFNPEPALVARDT